MNSSEEKLTPPGTPYSRADLKALMGRGDTFQAIDTEGWSGWSREQHRLLSDALLAACDALAFEEEPDPSPAEMALLEDASRALDELIATGDIIQCPFCADLTIPGPDESGESNFPKCIHFVGHWDSDWIDVEDGEDIGIQYRSVGFTLEDEAKIVPLVELVNVDWCGTSVMGWQVTYRFAKEPKLARELINAVWEKQVEEDGCW